MTITHSLKLLSLAIPLTIVGAGVDQQESVAQQSAARDQVRVAIATIANMLPVDGCSYPVTIGNRDFAPDAATTEVMKDLVPAGGTITAEISYTLTHAIGEVQCGFGTTKQLPEISAQVLRVLE